MSTPRRRSSSRSGGTACCSRCWSGAAAGDTSSSREGNGLRPRLAAGLSRIPCLIERVDDEQAPILAAASNTPSTDMPIARWRRRTVADDRPDVCRVCRLSDRCRLVRESVGTRLDADPDGGRRSGARRSRSRVAAAPRRARAQGRRVGRSPRGLRQGRRRASRRADSGGTSSPRSHARCSRRDAEWARPSPATRTCSRRRSAR